ncbi:tol-pal system-associated acyl-CoA thioesterase [Legionella waltersii]|uniref:Esterase n=1 Tax=Legionella waltersii TaxID=66969 RepID=A0A0W1A123_9GAMM|nr:tol-pal system-associated acyl-CoA thioesterase [Legionella waltersii]KTD75028.1 esterase [Legionella waltersii]SNV05473.1 thioesterase [Legionella waltersii]
MGFVPVYDHQIRVYAEDVDYMGIVYHSNYLCYFERARTELLRKNNVLLSELMKQDILFAIHEISIKYIYPARLDDYLNIKTSISEIRHCSLVFNQRMFNQDQKLICRAQIQVACVDSNLKPKRLPRFR